MNENQNKGSYAPRTMATYVLALGGILPGRFDVCKNEEGAWKAVEN